MPNTWHATTIQFMTQPELRAFFRVITRKRDRALFLVAYRHGLRASEGLCQLVGSLPTVAYSRHEDSSLI